MSIDWLNDIERDLESGRQVFACPGVARNQWCVANKLQDLYRQAKMTADARKTSVDIVRLVHNADALSNLFLVPTQVGDEGSRGDPQVQWSTVETREAAELVRDVSQGPAPFFGMEPEETIKPRGT